MFEDDGYPTLQFPSSILFTWYALRRCQSAARRCTRSACCTVANCVAKGRVDGFTGAIAYQTRDCTLWMVSKHRKLAANEDCGDLMALYEW